MCCLYLCRFVDFRGVSATPTPQISWHKNTSARFRLLCHLFYTKYNKHMLTPACAFVDAEKVYLCRSPASIMGQGLVVGLELIRRCRSSVGKPDSLMVNRIVCVCVFFPFILDIKFVERTSRVHTRRRSHRISHPPSFCGACLTFSREKDSAIHFPRRP